jgi:hypothetical protein
VPRKHGPFGSNQTAGKRGRRQKTQYQLSSRFQFLFFFVLETGTRFSERENLKKKSLSTFNFVTQEVRLISLDKDNQLSMWQLWKRKKKKKV